MNHSQRYAFEHGPLSFWRWNVRMVLPTMLVTWHGIWLPQQWHKAKDVFWRRDKSNGRVRCYSPGGVERADEKTRANWPKDADSAFQ
jgi:hypothetical protein